MSKKLQGASLFSLLLILFGCTSSDINTINRNDFFQDSLSHRDSTMTELVIGDMIELSVEVDGEMEVARYRSEINYYGNVTFPLVGDIKINRLKLNEARMAITRAYSAYYVNPPIIMLNRIDGDSEGEWGTVTVTGKVGQPGSIPITTSAGIRLTKAIQEAGGFTPSAKRNGIRVTRIDSTGKKVQVVVNYDEIGREGNAEADITLLNGDIVHVPERIF